MLISHIVWIVWVRIYRDEGEGHEALDGGRAAGARHDERSALRVHPQAATFFLSRICVYGAGLAHLYWHRDLVQASQSPKQVSQSVSQSVGRSVSQSVSQSLWRRAGPPLLAP